MAVLKLKLICVIKCSLRNILICQMYRTSFLFSLWVDTDERDWHATCADIGFVVNQGKLSETSFS